MTTTPGSDGDPWARPFWAPDPDGTADALLFFFVFGRFDPAAEFTFDPALRERFRIRGREWMGAMEGRVYLPEEHPRVFSDLLDGQIGKLLSEGGVKGLEPAVRAAPSCLKLVFEVPDPSSLGYLRDIVGVVTAVLEHGGDVAVFDGMALRWWQPGDWRRDVFEPEAPDLYRHADILVSEDERSADGRPAVWVHTRGLRKFGRPDVSVRRVTQERLGAVIELCNRMISFQARGGRVPDGQAVRMPNLPADWVCRHAGDFDDPDFNNVHLRIGPPDTL